jgi:putative flippase GtrA
MFVGVSAIVSNIIGYAVGSVVSYILNKKYTFKSTSKSKREALKFFTVLGISYGLNIITLQWLLGFMNPYLSQVVSAIVYTLSSFILVKILVFKEEV